LGIAQVDHGVYITDIVPDSPASIAWLMRGDIIISLNDMPIDNNNPFLYQLYTYQPWDTVRFHIVRSWDSLHRDVVLTTNM
jgi:S1-C subfamily serine protease